MNYNAHVAVINGLQEQMNYLPYALILNARVLTGISQDRMVKKGERMASNIFLYVDMLIEKARQRSTNSHLFLGAFKVRKVMNSGRQLLALASAFSWCLV